MVTVGNQLTQISGVRCVVTINGNVYALSPTFNCSWGNKQEETPVNGTDIQVVTTAEFHGEGDMTVIWSSEDTAAEEQFALINQPQNGQVGPINLVVQGTDILQNQRTFTWTGTVWPTKVSHVQQGASAVKETINFILNSRPVVA
jgi:hypothetical protein